MGVLIVLPAGIEVLPLRGSPTTAVLGSRGALEGRKRLLPGQVGLHLREVVASGQVDHQKHVDTMLLVSNTIMLFDVNHELYHFG